jgi:hypothetical protein
MGQTEDPRPDVGHGPGWSVDERPDGPAAFGPTGRLSGSAATREEAETAAHAAEQRLFAEHEEHLRLGRTVEEGDAEPPDVG